MVFGWISSDTNLSKYLMIFKISPEMNVIFVDFFYKKLQKRLWKIDPLTIMETEFTSCSTKFKFYLASFRVWNASLRNAFTLFDGCGVSWKNTSYSWSSTSCQVTYSHWLPFLLMNRTNSWQREIITFFPSFSVADPGFSPGGGVNSPGGANIWFCQIFSKTAWNWKNLGPRGGGASLAPPLDPPLVLFHTQIDQFHPSCIITRSHLLRKTVPCATKFKAVGKFGLHLSEPCADGQSPLGNKVTKFVMNFKYLKTTRVLWFSFCL